MQVRRKTTFAEIDTAGKSFNCPKCHIAFNPHLGHLMSENFQCVSCKAYLSFINTSPARTGPCPCCKNSRIKSNNLNRIVCGGCEAYVIHQIYDQTVKCHLCKHITITPVENYGIPQVNPVPPMENQVIVPRVYRPSATPAEIELPPLSPFFTPTPEIFVITYPDDLVTGTVRTSNREIEEGNTEDTESKKIRL